VRSKIHARSICIFFECRGCMIFIHPHVRIISFSTNRILSEVRAFFNSCMDIWVC